MTARESQKTGRLRLRHLLEKAEAIDWEMAEERPRFAQLAKDESRPSVVSSFNLFQTPPAIAAQMVSALGPKRGRTLEPSAGLGRLYRAYRQADPESHVTLIDESSECCGQLYRETESDQNARLICGDFLSKTVADLGLFDCIIMNPPFKMWRDIKHIQHAHNFLAPGGRLVALCANGPKQRAALEPIAANYAVLPAHSFLSEGTRVDSAMLVIDN